MSQLADLYARSPRGIRLGVETMQAALDRAGNPERHAPVVHVAGTNGKGSTCAMLEAALRTSGARVGLYTSPHLVRFSERIRIDGTPIDDAALERALAVALAEPELSFFEAATLAAFVAFREANVETIILEVGLGGRFDATNVETRKQACAITSIGLDHEEFLGVDLGSIAFEKAGILRAGVPCVLGAMPAEAQARITAEAARIGAPLILPPPVHLQLALRGPHQLGNAAVASALAQLLGLSPEVTEAGIAHAEWSGRYERIDTETGSFLLDGAHNPDGVAALVDTLRIQSEHPVVLVFGAVADKPALEMLSALRPLAAHAVYVAPGGKAPFDPLVLAQHRDGEVAPTVRAALERARELAGEGLVLVAGSLYLVGEARSLLLDLPSDPRIGM